jgi:hypothetical protein
MFAMQLNHKVGTRRSKDCPITAGEEALDKVLKP